MLLENTGNVQQYFWALSFIFYFHLLQGIL